MAAKLKELTREEGIHIPVGHKFRWQDVYGKGRFSCRDCSNAWTSEHSWLTLDMHKRYIKKKWMQKCQACGDAREPHFTSSTLEAMIRIVIERFSRDDDYESPPREHNTKPAHDRKNCEKCGWGKLKPCYQPKTGSSSWSDESEVEE